MISATCTTHLIEILLKHPGCFHFYVPFEHHTYPLSYIVAWAVTSTRTAPLMLVEANWLYDDKEEMGIPLSWQLMKPCGEEMRWRIEE